MHVSVLEWFVIALAVVGASTVQGVVGFGANLLAVPLVALIVPAALPGAMVIPGIPMAVAMATTERDHIDWRGSRFLLLGRLPGTAVGVAVVAAVSTDTLAIVIGAVVIAAVVLSAAASHLHPGVTPVSASVTGVATGITGTAAAIDGPPLALLYQNDPAPVFRSTLATQFAIGTVFTITGLLIGGQLHAWQVLLGITLIPSYFAGLALSFVLRPRLAGRDLRWAILAIAALAGVAAILRGLS
ncbi:MAG TPA: sulfite exporter TauE/SafE family protein [Acidimicrobiia bacterium]